MSPDFPEGLEHPDSLEPLPVPLDKRHPAMDTLDVLKRDRFELLSCYLDGEVTAAERKQVETWLATDSEIQHLHARLLNLRHGLHSLPTPVPVSTTDQMVKRVFVRIDRRPKLGLLLGAAGAVAAVFLGALSGWLPGSQSFAPQLAQQAPLQTSTSEDLLLALDQPPVEIPKAPAAKPNDAEDSGFYINPSQEIR